MIEEQRTIHLNRPVDRIFAFVVDARNLSAWQSGLIQNEMLTEGPLRVGTRFREVRRTGPRQSEIQAEVTTFEPNKRFATRTLTKPQVTVSYSFEPEGGGTRLNYKFVMLTGGVLRLLEPLIARSIRNDTDSDFEKLKRIVES